MGLGKVRKNPLILLCYSNSRLHLQTLQTIAFSAYLRESGHSKPFLVVCPLSVLHNWIEEYEKFAPKVRLIIQLPLVF
jgi:SNF2 family DNA or RNA helicase